MSLIQSQPWEVRLLLAAQEAFDSQALFDGFHADSGEIETAYAECDRLTREHSRTFYMASGLLPVEKRRAARALYAFCRITDDIVDDPHKSDAQRKETLDAWRAAVLSEVPPDDSPVCLAWADTQARFNIPRGYAQQLIDGVARDIYQKRYETFADLAEYSYGVASTVGLMAMHIVGFQSADALPYAVKLGVALQLTNILRDVGEDLGNGRIYLPADEMSDFNLSDADVVAGQVDDRWRSFLGFQIARARRLYEEALPGIALLNRDGRFAIASAARLYEAILADIERSDYDVFTRRARIGTLGKVLRLPGIWWISRRASV